MPPSRKTNVSIIYSHLASGVPGSPRGFQCGILIYAYDRIRPQEFQGVLHGQHGADTVIYKTVGEPGRPQGNKCVHNIFASGLRSYREPSRVPMQHNYLHIWPQEFYGVLHGPNVADKIAFGPWTHKPLWPEASQYNAQGSRVILVGWGEIWGAPELTR